MTYCFTLKTSLKHTFNMETPKKRSRSQELCFLILSRPVLDSDRVPDEIKKRSKHEYSDMNFSVYNDYEQCLKELIMFLKTGLSKSPLIVSVYQVESNKINTGNMNGNDPIMNLLICDCELQKWGDWNNASIKNSDIKTSKILYRTTNQVESVHYLEVQEIQ